MSLDLTTFNAQLAGLATKAGVAIPAGELKEGDTNEFKTTFQQMFTGTEAVFNDENDKIATVIAASDDKLLFKFDCDANQGFKAEKLDFNLKNDAAAMIVAADPTKAQCVRTPAAYFADLDDFDNTRAYVGEQDDAKFNGSDEIADMLKCADGHESKEALTADQKALKLTRNADDASKSTYGPKSDSVCIQDAEEAARTMALENHFKSYTKLVGDKGAKTVTISCKPEGEGGLKPENVELLKGDAPAQDPELIIAQGDAFPTDVFSGLPHCVEKAASAATRLSADTVAEFKTGDFKHSKLAVNGQKIVISCKDSDTATFTMSTDKTSEIERDNEFKFPGALGATYNRCVASATPTPEEIAANKAKQQLITTLDNVEVDISADKKKLTIKCKTEAGKTFTAADAQKTAEVNAPFSDPVVTAANKADFLNCNEQAPATPAELAAKAAKDYLEGKLDNVLVTIEDDNKTLKIACKTEAGKEFEEKEAGKEHEIKTTTEFANPVVAEADLNKYVQCQEKAQKSLKDKADEAIANLKTKDHFKDHHVEFEAKEDGKIEIKCEADHVFVDDTKTKEIAADAYPADDADLSGFAHCKAKEGDDDSSAVKAGAYLFVSALAGLLYTVL